MMEHLKDRAFDFFHDAFVEYGQFIKEGMDYKIFKQALVYNFGRKDPPEDVYSEGRWKTGPKTCGFDK